MSEYLSIVKAALNDAVGKQVNFTLETHLTEEEILDSLDSAVFLLNVEKATGVALSEEAVEQNNLFQVANLIAFLSDKKAT